MNALIGDSRVRDFKSSYLGALLSDNWCLPGVGMAAMEDLIRDLIIMHHGEDDYGEKMHVYISVGICNITSRLKGINYEEVIFDLANANAISSNFLTLVDHIKSFALKEGVIPVFTTIYPIALGDWNERRLQQKKTSYLSHQQDYPAMQSKMEETIQTINKMLISTNVKTGVATPLIHKHLIHNRRNSTFKYNLLFDGCHPSATFKIKISNTLAQAIKKNREKH